MYIENSLKTALRKEFNSSWRKLKQIENWFKLVQPEIEFFLYKDFNEDNPQYEYYQLEIFDDKHKVSGLSNRSFISLVNIFGKKIDLVKERMNERKRPRHNSTQHYGLDKVTTKARVSNSKPSPENERGK